MQTCKINYEEVVNGLITIDKIIVNNWDKCSFNLKDNVEFKVTLGGEDVTANYVVKPLKPGLVGSCDPKDDSTLTFNNVVVSVNKKILSRDFKETSTKTNK